jgi:general secretion pathway protein I
LVEVLVAFAILALSLAVLFRSMSTGLSNEQVASAATGRLLAGRSVLERVGTEIPLEQGITEGHLANGENWVLTLTPVGAEAPDPNEAQTATLFRADLTLTGSDGRSLHLSTLKLGP